MKKEIGKYITHYLKYGNMLSESHNKVIRLGKNLSKIASRASQHIVESEIDWFSKIQAKKDAQAINKLSEELNSLMKDYNEIFQRIEATYDDLGYKLNRYYNIKPLQEIRSKRGLNEKKRRRFCGR